MLLADRYLRSSGCWIDLATARATSVVVLEAGARREQIAWAERCAMLSTLRHPLFNPLIDFGIAGPSSLFEVYEGRGPVSAPAAAARTLVLHASRFLVAHGVELSAAQAANLLRAVEHARGPGSRDRPVGIVLQPRPALTAVTELLGAAGVRGTTTVRIAARRGMGLRTLWIEAARRARIEGFVTVCPAALARWPHLIEFCEGRHVCLLMARPPGLSQKNAAAALLARLARRGARPHLCLVAQEGSSEYEGAIEIQAMGRTAMTGMVYIDPDYGPTPEEILDAARRSEGCPGRFVSDLTRGAPFETGTAFTVHEAPEAYLPDPPSRETGVPASAPASRTAPAEAVSKSRIGSVLWRAGGRAAMLQTRGRHAAAARLLSRAARALEARHESSQAARYWLQLGWMARARGALVEAHEYAARAARTESHAEYQILAGLLDAVCWTDERRFPEAEAALRGLIAAAATLGSPPLEEESRAALARALCCADRPAEAADVLTAIGTGGDEVAALPAELLRSRVLRETGDLPGSMRAARAALARAAGSGDQRLLARAHRGLAEAHLAAGDVDQVRRHVQQGIAAARSARLPIALLRLRIVLFQALVDAGSGEDEQARLRSGLARA
jgi:tetratricopeptide (TPR) repeat protein